MANLLDLLKTYDDLRTNERRREPRSAPTTAPAPPRFPVYPERTSATDPMPVVEPPPPPPAPPSLPSPVTPARRQGVAPITSPAGFPPSAAKTIAPVSPPLASAVTPAPQRRSPEAGDAGQLYRDALVAVSRLFEAAVMESITPGRLANAVADVSSLCPAIVRATSQGRSLLRQAMGTYAEGEGFVLPHSVNVAVLAVELGGDLEFADHSLLDLCLAGFVHDIGSVRLPQGLLTKSESLTPSEWDEMRSRPTYSYEALTKLGSRYERVAEIVHQVYERLDGSGYPKGLQGDEILPEACILGTVDFFESFAHPRPYKTTLPGTANHGIQMLMQMADKFGASTLKALVGSIGLFPIGSYVRLSSGEIGRVVDVKKENPMRPQVEVLLTSEHQAPRGPRTLDLLAIPHIYVSRALTASDLRELGLLPPPSEMPLLAQPDNGRS